MWFGPTSSTRLVMSDARTSFVVSDLQLNEGHERCLDGRIRSDRHP